MEISNWALVIVTLLYVVLTYRLSLSSSEAAESAAAAFELQLNQAESPWFSTGGGGRDYPRQMEFALKPPRRGTYWIREVVLEYMSFASTRPGELGHRVHINQNVLPLPDDWSGESSPHRRRFPIRIDEVQTWGPMFQVEPAKWADPAFGHRNWKIESWELVVTYSLSSRSRNTRRVRVNSRQEPPSQLAVE